MKKIGNILTYMHRNNILVTNITLIIINRDQNMRVEKSAKNFCIFLKIHGEGGEREGVKIVKIRLMK